MAGSPDYPAIREAIGLILDGVTSLRSVERYETAAAGTNNLPCASIYLANDARVPGQEEFDKYAYQDEWHINIRLCMASPGAEVTAQQLYESLIGEIRSAFDPAGLLQPNGAGVVLESQMTTNEMHPQPQPDGTWVASFGLVTLVVT